MRMLGKSLKNYFLSKINIKVFIFTWLLLSVFELLFWMITSKYDYTVTQIINSILPAKDIKYIVLCNSFLFIYSILCGYVCNNISKKKYFLPTLLIPLILTIMEFVNFPTIPRFGFCAQIYHYFSFDIIWFLLISIILEKYQSNTLIYKFIICFQNIFELAIIWFAFSIMFNAMLNGGINEDAIVAIYQTNFKEAWYYFWGVNHGVILSCLMIISFIIICLFFIFLRKNTWRYLYKFHNNIIPFNISLLLITLLFCCAGIIGNMYLYFMPLSWKTIQFYNIYNSLIIKHQQLMFERQQLAKQYSTFYNNSTDALPNGADGLYVLIIGESLDRRFMRCYNHKHETTPFQDSLKMRSDTVFFNQIYACHTQTVKVVPMMMTLYNQYLPKGSSLFSDAELSLSLLDIAKNNGYDVYWISNQEKVSPHNSIISSIASSATQCFFMQELSTKTIYDHEIMPILQKINFSKRSLVIVHLMGSHVPYGLTYPRNIPYPDNFTPYEKSVFYNDKVIQQITEFFQSNGASLITYVSDHSDAVSIGKVHDPRPNQFNIEMIEIPMWIWTSREYRQKYPAIYEKLHSISNKIITNDLVFNMYMDLMHFQHIDKIDKYSPLSDNYILDTEPPKTLDGALLFHP